MKYSIIIGTKAEYIKMFPIMLEFKKRRIEYLFIHTGQHNLDDLIKTFKTKAPDVVINARDGFKGDTGGAFGWGLKTLPKIISFLKEKKDIEFVIVHGDTMSTAIGAVAGRLCGKQVCHVEAGLRSENIREPFPEELMRIIVDNISQIKFAPSEKSARRLQGQVFNVGNTSLDSLKEALSLKLIPKIHLPKKFVVATIHRHENIKSKKRMESIINILNYSQYPVFWFIHENTKQKLIEYNLMKDIEKSKNIFLEYPREYSLFVQILKNALFVYTDGGGMSEECAELSIPCIILRLNTEREELLDRWDQVLTKLNENIGKMASMKYSLPRKEYYIKSHYNNGSSASTQIVDILEGQI